MRGAPPWPEVSGPSTAVSTTALFLEQAKGYYGNKSRSYRVAERVAQRHSMSSTASGTPCWKGDFRKLWIQRINAGALEHGMSYSRLINGLHLAASRSTARSWPTWPR